MSHPADYFVDRLEALYRDIFGEFRLGKTKPANSSQKISSTDASEESLEGLISRRRSSRGISTSFLPANDVLELLVAASGLLEVDGEVERFRVPTAGGKAELRLFFFTRAERDLASGEWWEFFPRTHSAVRLECKGDSPMLERWEREAGASVIFAYPRRPIRKYANNLLHACVEVGAISQNLALLALHRYGRQCCMSGLVDVPLFARHLGSEVIPLHAISII